MTDRVFEIRQRCGVSEADIRKVFRAAIEQVAHPDDWDWHYDSDYLVSMLMEEANWPEGNHD